MVLSLGFLIDWNKVNASGNGKRRKYIKGIIAKGIQIANSHLKNNLHEVHDVSVEDSSFYEEASMFSKENFQFPLPSMG